MQVNAASENTSQVILNEDAWKSKLATKNIPAKDGLNSGNSKLKKRIWGEIWGNVEKKVGVNESTEELLEGQHGLMLKTTNPSRCEKPDALPGHPHLRGLFPGWVLASTFLVVIDLLINMGTGLCCCFACKSKQACSKFKLCKLGLALGIQTLFCFLLAASKKIPGRKAGGCLCWWTRQARRPLAPLQHPGLCPEPIPPGDEEQFWTRFQPSQRCSVCLRSDLQFPTWRVVSPRFAW